MTSQPFSKEATMPYRNRISSGLFTLLVLTSCKNSPEDVLIHHIDNVAAMTTANVSKPLDYIVQLRAYLRNHLPEIASATFELLVQIDKIDNPKDRAARADHIVESLSQPAQKLVAMMTVFASMNKGNAEVAEYLAKMQESYAQTNKKGGSVLNKLLRGIGGGLSGPFAPTPVQMVVGGEAVAVMEEPVGPAWKLAPLIVNLRVAEGTRYLKVALEFELTSEKFLNLVDQRKGRIKDQVIEFLSDLTVDDVVGSDNKQYIKERLLTRLNHSLEGESGGPVFRRVFFPEFLVQ
jgi:flagellar basal body-associated protein FliL